MSFAKVAFVRGIENALIRVGAIKVANEEMANAMAGQVAQQMPTDPLAGAPVPDGETAELAAQLIELANGLQQGAQAAGTAADIASKAAALAAISPPNVDPNTLPNAASNSGEVADANKDWPPAHANVGVDGVGGTQLDTAAGAIGKEKPLTAETPAPGSNSATELTSKASALKAAKLAALLKKISSDTAATADPNTLAAAAALATEVANEMSDRPPAHANVGVDGVGGTQLDTKPGAIGKEQPLPAATPAPGSNSATELVATKSAADVAYQAAFNEVVSKYADYLPPRLNTYEKVAAIQFLMGMPPVVRDKMAAHMQKTAELPPGLAEAVSAVSDSVGGGGEHKEEPKEEKKEEGGEKKEEEKEEKKEEGGEKKEEKKEGSLLLGNLRNLHRS